MSLPNKIHESMKRFTFHTILFHCNYTPCWRKLLPHPSATVVFYRVLLQSFCTFCFNTWVINVIKRTNMEYETHHIHISCKHCLTDFKKVSWRYVDDIRDTSHEHRWWMFDGVSWWCIHISTCTQSIEVNRNESSLQGSWNDTDNPSP